LKFYDARSDYKMDDGSGSAGWNGYVNLTCNGALLEIDYMDLHNRTMFQECFIAKPDGCLRHEYKNLRLTPGP
jgi:hypothetical protein